jgi:phospholipase/carboxylesterase
MSDQVIDDIVRLLPPLLQSMEALQFIARQLHPPAFDAVMEAVDHPDRALREARAALTAWPPSFADLRGSLDAACNETLAAFDGLRAAQRDGSDLGAVFSALRHASRAQEALYPAAARLPPVSDFFRDPAMREDTGLTERLGAAAGADTGVIHEGEPGRRGGFSVYVPEYYSPERSWPLVVALHGGSGNGRAFLWSWLRNARSRGAILIAPTAIGRTWALMGGDEDSRNLARILALAQARWNIDPARLLLTGMSDGGTFCYVSGLRGDSPFTHLAPVSATYHPLMIEVADAERLRGLPIFLAHGTLDWMFPVEVARQAQQRLSFAGAEVTYREIADLSHCYPREINAELLEWLGRP